MTVFPYVRRFVQEAAVVLNSKEAQDSLNDGPLRYLTEYFGLDFLDQEWKRALFLGSIVTILAFFVALFGNLLDTGDEEQRKRSDSDDSDDEEKDQETIPEDSYEALLGEFQASGKELTSDQLDHVEELISSEEIDPGRTESENGDANLTELERAEENAKEETLELWNTTISPQDKQADGGSKQFQSLVETLRPKWLTSEISANLHLVSTIYSKLFDSWVSSHKFANPMALNAMLAGLFFRNFNNEMQEVGSLDNACLAKAHYYLQFANACYATDLQTSGILRRSVKQAFLGARSKSDPWLRHMLFVDHLTQSVVLMFRGTSDFEDMIVDLLAEEVEFMNGIAHKGLLEEARQILTATGPRLKLTLEECGYSKVILTGHSLGGGTAVLASILLRLEHPELDKIDIECHVFGSPPVVGPPEAFPKDHPVLRSINIVSFVHNADVIPRTSLFGLELGMRLWIALDSVENFGFADRMQALFKGRLPENIITRAMELMNQSEGRSRYKKMITPGKCVWLVPQGERYAVLCPEDPALISTQPMFVGSTWLKDHSLVQYRAALESV